MGRIVPSLWTFYMVMQRRRCHLEFKYIDASTCPTSRGAPLSWICVVRNHTLFPVHNISSYLGFCSLVNIYPPSSSFEPYQSHHCPAPGHLKRKASLENYPCYRYHNPATPAFIGVLSFGVERLPSQPLHSDPISPEACASIHKWVFVT